ncbi:MAG: sugar ABC transporter ATP-binding protein [Anaerolineaceae bacterium]|jgi:ABC-type sugar transport system ATPase subunit|nr:sugar ABC transporter ATP-binding protein [Anaerolineaceae bacterium]
MSADENILELRNISKTFPGVVALKNINMSVRRGEVHALLGENGAGKSTLIKILSGYHQPDHGGEMLVDGSLVTFKNPKEAIDASIDTIYQELTLCPDMTVAENIVLDKQDQFKGFLQRRREYQAIAARGLKDLGQSEIDPNSLVKDLSIAQRQVVEIAEAITSKAKILLMDEPTSSISHSDADQLMEIIRRLRDNGVAVIYISHRLHEIGGIADRITVLRDGELVGTVNNSDVTENDLITMMVGRELTNVYPKREVPIGDVVLKVENLASGELFQGITFDVHKGEIFGIGGLIGSRRTETLEALFGMRPITDGKIFLHGEAFNPKNPRQAIKKKIAFVTEDRKKSGLVLCLPVYENINMLNAQQPSFAGYLNWSKLKAFASKHIKSLNIRVSRMEQVVGSLSGGNQQKVALAKWLDCNPDVIIFDEPTRGIDIGAKTEIYSIMGELAARGTAIVMVSSELPELISVADRILVMQEGRMKGIVSKEEMTQERVISLATQKA